MTWPGGIVPIISRDTECEFLSEVWSRFGDEQKLSYVRQLSRCLMQNGPELAPIVYDWFLWALNRN
jgi:hypothetical protein